MSAADPEKILSTFIDSMSDFADTMKQMDQTIRDLANTVVNYDEILSQGYAPGAVHWFRNTVLEVEVLVRLDRKCDECNGDWHCTDLLTGKERVLPEEWITLPALNPLEVLALVGDENQ